MEGGAKTGQPAGNAGPADGNSGAKAPPQAGGVLRALLAAGLPVSRLPAAILPPPAIPSLERGVALAVARAARRAGGLPVTAENVAPDGMTLAELAEYLPEGSLIAIVEGAAERLGVVALCPAMIASLIEVQAMGRISSRAATPRRATRTDAAIAADFVNALLSEIGAGVASHPMGAALSGFRYASYLDDPRPLGLMLEDVGFHALSMTLRLGADGERTGHVFLAIPGSPQITDQTTQGAEDHPTHASVQADDQVPDAPPMRHVLSAAVAQAPVRLAAILCRKSITLRELRALRTGATLSMTCGAIDAVQIQTATGQIIATGQLGEAEGLYAVRLRGSGSGKAPPDGTTLRTQTPHGDNIPDPDSAEFGAFADSLEVRVAVDDANFEPPMSDLSAPDTFRFDQDEVAPQISNMAN